MLMNADASLFGLLISIDYLQLVNSAREIDIAPLIEGWYIGRLTEVPGVFSQGKSLEELEENIKEVYTLMIEEEKISPYTGIQTKEIGCVDAFFFGLLIYREYPQLVSCQLSSVRL